MKTLENLDKVRRIIVWGRRPVGYIQYKKKRFFRKGGIYFYSRNGAYWDKVFKSNEELSSYVNERNLLLEGDTVYEKWSIDLIYSYKCSKTIYFNSKTAQNDWLKSHSSNFINIEENGE